MRDAPHRLLIVSGLVGSVWIGFAASRFHFFDYQYECGLVDLCDYADVIRGREGHWLYFGVAALVLAVGVFLHVRRGRAVPPRPEPWSPLLLLVPGLAWALALPVAFLTMFWGDHLMAAGLLALLVGAAWLASQALGRVRGPRIDLAACHAAVTVGAVLTLVWLWVPQTAVFPEHQGVMAFLLGVGSVAAILGIYRFTAAPRLGT